MNYLKAVMQKNEQQKIDELKKIISIGEKINKDVRPDKKKLEILLERQNEASLNNTKNISEKTKSTNNSSNKLFSINSVRTSGNDIIIDFKDDIDNSYIKFFKLNQTKSFRNVFDITGYYKDAIPTRLEIDGVDKITLGQFKSDVLRIVLSSDKSLSTSYKLNKRQIIISVDSLQQKSSSNKSINEPKVDDNNPSSEPINIDTQNTIRSIDSNDNKIVVKFNKDYSKKDITQISKKNGPNYEYTFDINGKYKYTTPTKLNIDNIDNVTVNDNKNSVRIVISNKSNPKITYSLSSRELVINIISNSSSPNTNTITKKKEEPIKEVPTALPPSISAQMTTGAPKGRKKTIVLDAGHGGDDVGAVGPNKRYEKVINLNVTKYLASILKQRGYTVYLTRDSDFFIKVIDRTVLANEKNADLFMSIHTNAVPLEKANEVAGIETFFLSPAREERAKRVAALENKSDIREMSDSSKDVFLESLNRPRITASHKFAIDVQAGILQSTRSKYKDIQDSGVREGPFWVLVGAQMPSILVEVGYISHPVEGKRLYDKSYQQLLANGIANGVDSYFSKNP
ncbi:MAG: N-acetylmuramoyl-L-alanine amidase [Aliarcobacter sp.]|nr:N-acetylmuramoyl-L-alanine amidase [Aliarcobacter sp.]